MPFRLVSFKAPNRNVGDDFSEWLFSRALGDRLQHDGNILLFGVGSILSQDIFSQVHDASITGCAVFGSGARRPYSLPNMNSSEWKVYCVRGHLTAYAAGLATDAAVADPAILAPRLHPATAIQSDPVGIVPYFTASEAAWQKVANKLGWRVISPKLPVERFIAELTLCSRVWCESMHGAIFADAYGIPWRPISATSLSNEGRTHAFKWTDFCSALGVSFDPWKGLPLPDQVQGTKGRFKERVKIEIVAHLISKADQDDRHTLSDRRVLLQRQEELLARLDKMCLELTGKPSELALSGNTP
ncbi:hypothetical protein [Fuscovulum ytuae]|uniref:Polysaccharide pyruvyl transferase domain-containing protein n=1 Tax=Fuscovulum ytuae TaxID=3042299 RepID=A0ABY8Q5R4_9RHOB|nr:hypothetical protein [Fuscovulum sp. YMD61]WGV15926.1 hypothetical protein QF092_16995 [Fuscovulum sp. YMD61]